MEERLREHEVRILQMNNSHETLQRKYLQLTELRHVLRETAVFFEQVRMQTDICIDQDIDCLTWLWLLG